MSSCEESRAILRQMPTYQSILYFFEKREPYYRYPEWESFVALCEAWRRELWKLYGSSDVQQLETLEKAAEEEFEALFAGRIREHERSLLLCWFIPDALLPWAARFAMRGELHFTLYDPDVDDFLREIPEYLCKRKESDYEEDPETKWMGSSRGEELNEEMCARFREQLDTMGRLSHLQAHFPYPDADRMFSFASFCEAVSAHSPLRSLQTLLWDDLHWRHLTRVSWDFLEHLDLGVFLEYAHTSTAKACFPVVQSLRCNVHKEAEESIIDICDPSLFPSLQKFQLEYDSSSTDFRIPVELCQTLEQWKQLKHLEISGCLFEEDEIDALLESLSTLQLSTFSLFPKPSNIGFDRLFQGVVRDASFAHIETLRLRQCSVSPDVFTQFASREYPLLRVFEFGFDEMDDSFIEVLCETPLLAHCKELTLHSHKVTADGARLLTNSPLMTSLELLSIEVKGVGTLNKEECLRAFGDWSPQERFAQLREHLSQHGGSWPTLAKELDGWEDQESLEQLVLPYLRDHFKESDAQEEERWRWNGGRARSSGNREMSKSWLQRLEEEGSFVALTMIDEATVHTEQQLLACIASEHLENLRFLCIQQNYNTPAFSASTFSRLREATFWPHLRHLTFEAYEAPKARMTTFFQALQGTSLESLQLHNVLSREEEFSADLADCLVESGVFQSLKSLEVKLCKLVDSGLETLCHAEGWQRLEKLRIRLGYGEKPLSNKALQTLAMRSSSLVVLELEECQLQAGALRIMLEHGSWNQLRWLALTDGQLGVEDAQALAKADLPALEHLDLHYHPLLMEEGTLTALMQSSWFPKLQLLYLAKTGLRNKDAIALANCPALQGIQYIALYSNPIGWKGCEALANSPYLREKNSTREWYKQMDRNGVGEDDWDEYEDEDL